MSRDDYDCAASFPVVFPSPEASSTAPVWTGRSFRVGALESSVLCYRVADSGWTDQLTAFHEDEAGEHHYIDCASRSHTSRQLRRWLKIDRPVLADIGCSSGWMLRTLLNDFPSACVLGADYVRGPLEKLANTLEGVPLLQFDLTMCPLPDACIDGIVLLNVLEHIEEDEAALAHCARILKPGGIAVIEVPAGPHLYDVYDKLLLHRRRYAMEDLVTKVKRSGLQVLEKSHLGFLLYAPFWLAKKLGQRHLGASEEVQRNIVSRNIRTGSAHPLLHGVMRAEAAMRDWFSYPLGIRCLVTCRKAE